MTQLRHGSKAARGIGDYIPLHRPSSYIPPPPKREQPVREAKPTRHQQLLYFAKREIEDAEEELGPDSREFAVYCSCLRILLAAKHLPENE